MERTINSKFTDKKWDNDGGNKNYWEFYRGKFHHEPRNGLGTHLKRKTKWVSPAIITGKKRTCFRCGIVGHKINNICTTTGGRRHHHNDGDSTHDDDDDSENDHRKNWFGKKVTPDQNHGQKLKLFHGNLKQKWGEFPKKKIGRAIFCIININKSNKIC